MSIDIEEVREIIEDACAQQVAIGGYDRAQRRPVSTERAADIIRRVLENLPEDMNVIELSEIITKSLGTGYRSPGASS